MNRHFTQKAWQYARPAGLVAGVLLFSAVSYPASAQLLASSRGPQMPTEAPSPVVETVPLKLLLKQWETEYHVSIFYESGLVGNKRVPLPTGLASLEARLNT